MNIFEKMLKATDEINRVAKNLSVGIGQNQYKAVGEADVLAAVKPVEVAIGIYSYPLSRKIIESNVYTTSKSYKDRDGKEETKETNTFFIRLETTYRFVNTEKPEEFVDVTTYGDGADTQDKAPGKAMTYSDKYALLKAYKIETGEDPDQHLSEPMKKNEYTKKPQIDTPDAAQAEIDKIKAGLINKVQITSIENELKRTGIKTLQITIHGKKYAVDDLSKLNFEQWKESMEMLSTVPDKKETDLPL